MNARASDAAMSAAQVRAVFGENLRQLAEGYSITRLCEDLGVQRSKFSRWLKGESHPRPDELLPLLNMFDVDARVLTMPLDQFRLVKATEEMQRNTAVHPYVANNLSSMHAELSEDYLPSGLYRLCRESFWEDGIFVTTICQFKRVDGRVFVRGREQKEMFIRQGMPPEILTGYVREFRGEVYAQDDGFMVILGRSEAERVITTYATRKQTHGNNFYVGFSSIHVEEGEQARAKRTLFERLPNNVADILKASRTVGVFKSDELSQYYRRVLKPGEPFR